MQRSWIFALALVLLLLSACFSSRNGSNNAAVATTQPAAAPAVTPQADVTPVIGTSVITDTAATAETFIVWVPPEIAAQSPAGDAFLQEQLPLALLNYPDHQVRIEQKAISGQGGILSYLRTGRNVAPDILPDLVILRSDQLATAVADNLVHPIGDLLDPALVDDLYPAAQALVRGQEENEWLGYPFALTGLSHVAYNNQLITSTLPVTWTSFAALAEQSFVFPAAGRNGATYGLQLYLSAGGRLVNEAGQPDLQFEPLLLMLEQLSEARQREFIAPSSNNLTTLAESWQLFQDGTATIVQTTADQILSTEMSGQSVGVAPLPGNGNRVTPFVNGWIWVITTSDPAKQAMAAEVVTFMSAETTMAEWTRQNGMLPARRAALALWSAENGYVRFVQEELELAEPFPKEAGSTLLNILGNAVFDVVSLTKTPQVAAEEAIEALQQ